LSGINFYDTADSYAQGRSETLLGEVFRARRSAVIVATKAGYRISPAGSFLSRLKPLARPLLSRVRWLAKSAQNVRASQRDQDFSPAWLRAAVDGSLARLRTDYIDLLQLHNPPASAAADSAVFETLESLRQAGKIRHYGVSCAAAEDAAPFVDAPGLAALQFPVNVLNWESVRALLAAAQSRNLAVIANQPLAGGPANLAADAAGLLPLNGRTVAEAALQFALNAPGVSVAIAGMTRRTHLAENLGALGDGL